MGAIVHFVGIGGAGMSGSARLMRALGLVVTGSDRTESASVRGLRSEGFLVAVGHRAGNVPDGCALVVRSPAIAEDNPELAAARQMDVPVIKRAVLLGGLLDARTGICVAGTHGKTTTSGLLAWILVCAGLDPTVLVGGQIADICGNARSGNGPHLVLEADEYDRSFLHGHPSLAIVLNVELDHPDIYADLGAVQEAFAAFVGSIKPAGRLLGGIGSGHADFLVSASRVPVERFALEDDPLAEGRAEWLAVGRRPNAGGQMFEVRHAGTSLGVFTTKLAGRHNALNCLAAIAASQALGVDTEVIRVAVGAYHGVGRRFQVVGSPGGVTVIDDYAHHPAEVAATLAAARERYPDSKLWAVLEPHTYSRVAALADQFAAALQNADRVLVTPIYAAREQPMDGIGPDLVARGVPGAVVADSLYDAAQRCASEAGVGDVVLFLGAGDAPSGSRACARALTERAVAGLMAVAAEGSLGGEPTPGAAMSAYTTLHVGGPATCVVRCRDLDVLEAWWQLAWSHRVPVTVLGRGSNILVPDRGLSRLVLLNRCAGWSLRADDGTARVDAESGVTLSVLATRLAAEGWSGLEAGAGIPGTIGGAVVGNAGAHGWCMADSVVSIEVMRDDGLLEELPASALAFGYRRSDLKGRRDRLITRVTVEVRREHPQAIQARMDAHSAQRRASQPAAASAGSTFRNPPGDAAGRLVEAAGMKGTTVGGATISPVHANFIVNHGDATAADVLELIDRARRAVLERFGVLLELEIEILDDADAV